VKIHIKIPSGSLQSNKKLLGHFFSAHCTNMPMILLKLTLQRHFKVSSLHELFDT